MNYSNVYTATFLSRPNRFIAHCMLDGNEVTAHVPNTGRCAELFVPGCTAYLQHHDNPARKTQFTLIAVDSNGDCINIDSQAPNQIVYEYLLQGNLLSGMSQPAQEIRREKKFSNSRFDLCFLHEQQTCFTEVKGVTLRHGTNAKFPDAPTQRGVKHIQELIHAQQQGYQAYLVFVIQMSRIRTVSPNWKMHPEFGKALQLAAAAGVQLCAYNCNVSPNHLSLCAPIEIIL